MPIIRPGAPVPDVQAVMVQADIMRAEAMVWPVVGAGPLVTAPVWATPAPTIPGAIVVGGATEPASWASPRGPIAREAGIACQGGVWLPIDPRGGVLGGPYIGQAGRLAISGTTRDSAGAALGSCRVVCLEVGRLTVDGAPVVGETISDGSGLFSIAVPMNTAYQLVAYKPGSPDVAGISLASLTPAAV